MAKNFFLKCVFIKGWCYGWWLETGCVIPPLLPRLCLCSRWKLAHVSAARFSCCTTALFIKREAACSKPVQIITICLQSPELNGEPAPNLPSNFLSQNWTCGSLCVTTSLPSPRRHRTFSQYFFSRFRCIIAVYQLVSKTWENIMPWVEVFLLHVVLALVLASAVFQRHF